MTVSVQALMMGVTIAAVAATEQEGRAMAGYFGSSGIGNILQLPDFSQKWPFFPKATNTLANYPTQSPEEHHTKYPDNKQSTEKQDSIDSDDLFDGLSAVWNHNSSENENKNNEAKTEYHQRLPDHYYSDISEDEKYLSHDDLDNYSIQPSNYTSLENNNDSDQNIHKTDEVSSSSSMQDHWTRLKSILQNMRGIIESEFPESNTDDRFSFAILDKIIAFGDKMDILKRLNKTFNNGMVNFLTHRWMEISESIINGSPVLKTLFAIDTADLTSSLMMPLLKNVGHFFKKNAFKHLKDLDFVNTLMKSSGFHENEIEEVFNLLDLNTDVLNGNNLDSEGRQYSNNYIDKTGGYGHSGYGGGGYMMQTIDPFVLLAGLAFATFLAFLLFRLLSQTTGRRRSIPDMSLNLDLSDMPEVMNNLYNMLDSAERKFGPNVTDLSDPIEKFGSSANNLWKTFQADRLERSCMRRYLCESAEEPVSLDTSESSSAIHQLALTSLAQLLGEELSAKMVDGIQHHRVNGEPQECRALAPHCDDALYTSIGVSPAHSI